MYLNQSRQTKLTQIPLSFAGLKKMNSEQGRADEMSLQQRIRYVLTDLMPGPDRGKQIRLAQIADESKQVVNHWLTGKTMEIQYAAARKICEHFGLHMDWLMRGKGPIKLSDKEEATPSTENMALVYLTAKEQEIITAFRSTDEIGQTVIAAAADKMKKN